MFQMSGAALADNDRRVRPSHSFLTSVVQNRHRSLTLPATFYDAASHRLHWPHCLHVPERHAPARSLGLGIAARTSENGWRCSRWPAPFWANLDSRARTSDAAAEAQRLTFRLQVELSFQASCSFTQTWALRLTVRSAHFFSKQIGRQRKIAAHADCHSLFNIRGAKPGAERGPSAEWGQMMAGQRRRRKLATTWYESTLPATATATDAFGTSLQRLIPSIMCPFNPLSQSTAKIFHSLIRTLNLKKPDGPLYCSQEMTCPTCHSSLSGSSHRLV
jgi:hypothetical protein